MDLENMALAAKRASYEIAHATSDQKNSALKYIIDGVQKRSREIIDANEVDIQAAKAAHLSAPMLDRLMLNKDRLDAICSDVEQVIGLPDVIGECFEKRDHAGLKINKIRTSIGVLGVIYESRPNITIDISTLALKSGNCAILRGGSETLTTNRVLVRIIQEALTFAQLPFYTIQLVPSTDRNEIQKMLRLHESIDLIIPRGGAALHRFCRENSSIPVITGGMGICHLFVDQSADLERSLEVIINAKTQAPTVCNALDTLLVHETIADCFIPQVIDSLEKKGVAFRLDERSFQIRDGIAAQPEDWDTEWLSLTLGIKVVKDLHHAIEHIRQHSTGHSDGILTEERENASCFVAQVDSAAVYVNASTRFTDGGQLGLGAEVAISTQKLHARGPMGLRELTSYKWVISGDYAIRGNSV